MGKARAAASAGLHDQRSHTVEAEKGLDDRGILLVTGEVNEGMARNVVRWILEANARTPRSYDHLTLVVNSPGGALTECFAMVDAIRGSRLPVHTVAVGQVMSAGLLLAMSGEPGHRSITSRAVAMSHQWARGAYGKSFDMAAEVRGNEIYDGMMMRHYLECTGLPEKDIRGKLLPPHDVYLTPKEAVRLGLFDKVVDSLS